MNLTIENVKELRIAWSASKEGHASDTQWLLLISQPSTVLDLLADDYNNFTSPYRKRGREAGREAAA